MIKSAIKTRRGTLALAVVVLCATVQRRAFAMGTPQSHAVMSDLQGPTTSASDQANAEALRARALQSTGGAATGALAAFPAVGVASGMYKYVLINAASPGSGETKTLLRSGPGNYHVDVATPTVEALKRAGLVSEIPGGGRITRDDDTKEISIYGFSYGFGKGDHALAAEMCRAEFPDYAVTWSDDGY